MNARRVRSGGAAELPMTPMIDIVFLLMVFFLMAFQPVDVLAHLDVTAPAGAPGTPVPVLRLSVDAGGYALNGQVMDEAGLQTNLARLGALDARQTVILDCSPEAPHARLVYALNGCARAGLDRLSVVTRPPRD